MHRLLSTAILVLCPTAPAAAVAATPPVSHPAVWRPSEAPRVGVADAVALEMTDGGLVLIGGFTDRLQATAAVQRRNPRHGWEPVGTSLLTPRASPLVARLPEDRVLVVGGWKGTLPHDVVHLDDAELCDPRRPERRSPLPPPFPGRDAEGLEGGSLCTLADGRILLVHDRDLAVFDSTTLSWSHRHRFEHPRRDAALLPLPDGGALVVGGSNEDAPPIEAIDFGDDGSIGLEPWDVPLDPRLRHAALHAVDGGELLLAGGELAGRSLTDTWILNPGQRSVRRAAPLPFEGGLSRGRFIAIDDRLLLLGGECVEGRFPTPARYGAVLRPPWDRPLRIAASPLTAVRSMVVPRSRGAVLIGGYRFDAGEERSRRIQVHRASCELSLPVFAVVD